jgi:restriction system protein
VRKDYPATKEGAVPVYGGVLYRFVHEMVPGDHVVYPSKVDRQVHIGTVAGQYQHQPGAHPRYPHRRAVKWTTALPRTRFSQGALYEIGSALTLFQVKNHEDEFLAAAAGGPSVVADEAADDAAAAIVAEEIELTTRDSVLKRLARELKGHPFAEFVAHVLGAMGYRTRVSPPGPDKGIDIVAHKDELGFEPPIVKVQVKSTEGSVGAPEVQALYGNVEAVEFGLLVTLGTFTNQAHSFAHSKANLRLVDGDEVVEMVLRHYDYLDARYKGLIPLKRVYLPEPAGEVDTG